MRASKGQIPRQIAIRLPLRIPSMPASWETSRYMTFSRSFIELHVRVLNNGTQVFRATRALKLGGGLFKLVACPDYDPGQEQWELLPGATVRVELHPGTKGDFPLAVRP